MLSEHAWNMRKHGRGTAGLLVESREPPTSEAKNAKKYTSSRMQRKKMPQTSARTPTPYAIPMWTSLGAPRCPWKRPSIGLSKCSGHNGHSDSHSNFSPAPGRRELRPLRCRSPPVQSRWLNAVRKQTRKTRKTRTSERIVKGILKGIPNMSRTQCVLLFSNVKPKQHRKAWRLGLSLCAARRCSLATGHLDVKR